MLSCVYYTFTYFAHAVMTHLQEGELTIDTVQSTPNKLSEEIYEQLVYLFFVYFGLLNLTLFKLLHL